MPLTAKPSLPDCGCDNVVPLLRVERKAPVSGDRQLDAADHVLVDLLHRTAAGDRVAFSELYRSTSPKLFGLALKLIRQRAGAEEVLQEAFIQAWRHAGRYSVEHGAPMAWLYGIVRFRALDRLRRERRHESQTLESETENADDAIASPLDELVTANRREALKSCLNQLDVRSQKCILLSFYEGYTHAELSQRLDAPLGSVKSWIRRGMQAVRRCLEARGFVET